MEHEEPLYKINIEYLFLVHGKDLRFFPVKKARFSTYLRVRVCKEVFKVKRSLEIFLLIVLTPSNVTFMMHTRQTLNNLSIYQGVLSRSMSGEIFHYKIILKRTSPSAFFRDASWLTTIIFYFTIDFTVG